MERCGSAAPALGRAETQASAGPVIDGPLRPAGRKTGWMMAERAGVDRPHRVQSLSGSGIRAAHIFRDGVRDHAVEVRGLRGRQAGGRGWTLAGGRESRLNGMPKKRAHSVGAACRSPGAAGRIGNRQIGVFACCATRRGRTLMDRRPCSPRAWAACPRAWRRSRRARTRPRAPSGPGGRRRRPGRRRELCAERSRVCQRPHSASPSAFRRPIAEGERLGAPRPGSAESALPKSPVETPRRESTGSSASRLLVRRAHLGRIAEARRAGIAHPGSSPGQALRAGHRDRPHACLDRALGAGAVAHDAPPPVLEPRLGQDAPRPPQGPARSAGRRSRRPGGRAGCRSSRSWRVAPSGGPGRLVTRHDPPPPLRPPSPMCGCPRGCKWLPNSWSV